MTIGLTFVFLATVFGQTPIPEVEPNGTTAQADAAPILVTSTTTLSGAISPVADVDTFRVSLAAAGVVHFETFTNLQATDCDATTMDVRLYDSVGTPILADTTGFGIRQCGSILMPLAAGGYYIRNEERGNNATVPFYTLRVTFMTNSGSEAEPNDALGQANLISVPPSFIFGDHSVNTDSDYYVLTLAAGQSVRAEIIEGDRAVETCESNGVDSRLTLYNSVGTILVDDDDDGRGFCSLIDGRGTTPLDFNASNLPAGIYYLQVRASSFSQTSPAGQFIYRLAIELTSAPTAATVSIDGRVADENGRAVTNTMVVITDSAGNTRTARPSSFGYYRFDGIEVGQNYVITVNSKRYTMPPRLVSVADQISDLDLTVTPHE